MKIMEETRNLILPGNPRYQPAQLKAIFGYDNLYMELARVEIANILALAEIEVIPPEEIAQLTAEIEQKLLAIPTKEVDYVEKEFTKHDVRAWVRIAQEIISGSLKRWIHVPLTSYDALDTGRILQFSRSYTDALKPSLVQVTQIFIELASEFSGQLQIGRTHGQHALPITVGFWLATVLNRIICNWLNLDMSCSLLRGKISGAVGAYNAQFGLGLDRKAREKTGKSFEELVLEKLGLKSADISTQIIPPEPIAYFLFCCTMLSATFAQFGRDCRHLMRSEIGEIQEEFEESQVGSSTMAQKRNPINFENSEGMYIKTKNEFGKVLDTLISEHQRDLVASPVARDFPIIVINLQQQLNTLLRKNKAGVPFLKRIKVNKEACMRNFQMSSNVILAEPIYIALQMAGYQGDAHELVNRKLVPLSQKTGKPLAELLEESPEAQEVLGNIPPELIELFHHPEKYTGNTQNKIFDICINATEYLNEMKH